MNCLHSWDSFDSWFVLGEDFLKHVGTIDGHDFLAAVVQVAKYTFILSAHKANRQRLSVSLWNVNVFAYNLGMRRNFQANSK